MTPEMIGILILVGHGLGFWMGKYATTVKLNHRKETELSLVALAASLYAAAETRAIKQAPVLRQYIERFVPGKEVTDGEMQQKMSEMSKEFEKMFSVDKTKVSEKAPEVHKNGLHPEDLV